MKKLTAAKYKRYMQEGGKRCPACWSTNTSFGDPLIEKNELVLNGICDDCNTRFVATYILNDVDIEDNNE